MAKALYRGVYIDPDFRPKPKTKTFCARCQKDLKDSQSRRFICYDYDTAEAVHPDEWSNALSVSTYRFAIMPIGEDCAKKIGLSYTRETPSTN